MVNPNEGDILFDIEYKETFRFEKKRDEQVLLNYPDRFRLASDDDIALFPVEDDK